ncbi:MAG: hypothetical protein HY796_13845 [Elusimicrobia bacterium]|nr:hypothetical protein [Elusimicrobiota bacterium]
MGTSALAGIKYSVPLQKQPAKPGSIPAATATAAFAVAEAAVFEDDAMAISAGVFAEDAAASKIGNCFIVAGSGVPPDSFVPLRLKSVTVAALRISGSDAFKSLIWPPAVKAGAVLDEFIPKSLSGRSAAPSKRAAFVFCAIRILSFSGRPFVIFAKSGAPPASQISLAYFKPPLRMPNLVLFFVLPISFVRMPVMKEHSPPGADCFLELPALSLAGTSSIDAFLQLYLQGGGRIFIVLGKGNQIETTHR